MMRCLADVLCSQPRENSSPDDAEKHPNDPERKLVADNENEEVAARCTALTKKAVKCVRL